MMNQKRSAPGFSSDEETQHVTEAWRRARLAGRSTAIGVYDFPPHVGASVAATWIAQDAARRRSQDAKQLEERQARFAASALPLSVCGDITVVMGMWPLS